MSSYSPPSDSRRRMRSVLRRIRDLEGTPPRSAQDLSDAPPPRLASQRADSYHPVQHNGRRGSMRRSYPNHTEPGTDLDSGSARLSQWNEDQRFLLQQPLHERPQNDDDDGERRRKRRRTDTYSRPEHSYPRIDYGYQGQADPGRLKMEVINADRGDMDRGNEARHSWPILADDTSIYQTRSRRSNIVLCHPGQPIFTLERIVIKLPPSPGGFHGPDLQGLVFVSLHKDEAFDRTTQYQIHHFPTSRFGPHATHGRSAGLRSLSSLSRLGQSLTHGAARTNTDATTSGILGGSHLDCEASTASSEAEDDLQTTRRSRRIMVSPPLSSEDEGSNGHGYESDELAAQDTTPRPPQDSRPSAELRSAVLSRMRSRLGGTGSSANEGGRLPPPYDLHHDIISASEDEDYNNVLAQFDFDEVLRRGAATSADRRLRRRRNDGRRFVSSAISRLDDDDDAALPVWAQRAGSTFLDRTPRGDTPIPTELDGGTDPTANQEFELLEPAAHFSTRRAGAAARPASMPEPPTQQGVGGRAYPIADRWSSFGGGGGLSASAAEEECSRVSIRFDPPLSGRFLLLKLWKTGGRGPAAHVELMRVRCEGYAGVRWFPAREFA